MAKYKKQLDLSGLTTDNKLVLKGHGVYHYVTSKGVPLELLLQSMKENNLVLDWTEYLDVALQNGAKLNNTILNIEFAIKEVYGVESSKTIGNRLRFLFQN